MSQENVEIVRRGYAALNEAYRAGDINVFRHTAEERWDPDDGLGVHIGSVLGHIGPDSVIALVEPVRDPSPFRQQVVNMDHFGCQWVRALGARPAVHDVCYLADDFLAPAINSCGLFAATQLECVVVGSGDRPYADSCRDLSEPRFRVGTL